MYYSFDFNNSTALDDMSFSNKCKICSKKLNAESMAELLDRIEDHLLEHVESKIELNEEFLEDFDQESSRTIAETQFGENQLSAEILDDTDSEESSNITGMNIANYDNIEEGNYSEEEQYGEEYVLEGTDPIN